MGKQGMKILFHSRSVCNHAVDDDDEVIDKFPDELQV